MAVTIRNGHNHYPTNKSEEMHRIHRSVKTDRNNNSRISRSAVRYRRVLAVDNHYHHFSSSSSSSSNRISRCRTRAAAAASHLNKSNKVEVDSVFLAAVIDGHNSSSSSNNNNKMIMHGTTLD